MDIRPPATPEELRAAHELTVRAWRDAFGEFVSKDAMAAFESTTLDQDFDAQYPAVVGLDRGTGLVAVDGENAPAPESVVGWAFAIWDGDHTKPYVGTEEAELRILYVDPDHQGEGVGSDLLSACLARLPAGVERVVLETFEANEAGRAFYESRGFERRETVGFDLAGETYPSVVYARTV